MNERVSNNNSIPNDPIINNDDTQTDKTLSSQNSLSSNPFGKPFSCHKCQRTFNSKYNVIRHLKQYHADKRMFKCNICGRDYKWVDSLHKHMKLHKHKDIITAQQPQVIQEPPVYNYVTLTDDMDENDCDKTISLVDLACSKSTLVSVSSLSLNITIPTIC